MKKHIYFFAVLVGMIVLSSCNSVRVASDYDTKANFNNYKTFAYFKTGIDKAEINDIDKRRILRAIESEMVAKGFTKSETPDLLVSIFTKSRENVNVNRNNFGWGFGWGFYGASFGTSVSTSTEGTLYIDLIDAKTNELVWQGQGSGYLTKNVKKKQERINEFVEEILEAYPPEMDR
jgi:PBP1b-binding outer membrane lipoprotein LpoB